LTLVGTVAAPDVRRYDDLEVRIHHDGSALAADAAEVAAAEIATAIKDRGRANVMLATGNSQLEFLDHLIRHEVDWSRVTVLHMDEYVGVDESHSASFARYIRERLVDVVQPAAAYLMDGAADAVQEISRYSRLLASHPLDVTCLGIGENGHLAFNDPPVADFADPVDVKEVELDDACRRQQVGEGHFPDFDAVPRTAITLTIPALLRARRVLAIVPERRKSDAVHATLMGPIATACPASVLRRTPHSTLFLDRESAALL
jgi:glucosamine-6-phosphate deaminase